MNATTLSVSYIGSYSRVGLCPPLALPEYCFIGRSNVGKSSMINSITGLADIARTSKKPGKTQNINLFKVSENPEWMIADLPGYGYAQVSKSKRGEWSSLIDGYVMGRENLMCTFLLIDIRHPQLENDRKFMEFLGEEEIPFCILFTKSDKLKSKELEEALRLYTEAVLEMWVEMPPYFVTSSLLSKGREEILAYIREMNTVYFNPST